MRCPVEREADLHDEHTSGAKVICDAARDGYKPIFRFLVSNGVSADCANATVSPMINATIWGQDSWSKIANALCSLLIHYIY